MSGFNNGGDEWNKEDRNAAYISEARAMETVSRLSHENLMLRVEVAILQAEKMVLADKIKGLEFNAKN